MEQAPLKSVSVLVVEDNAFASRVVTLVLEKLGVGRVIAADNGAQALEILHEADTDIDIFICDLEMPEMGGYEFIRRIRYGSVPKYKDVPILVLTGKDTEINVKKSRIYQINGFMVKPPRAAVLEKHIRQTLGL